jgi:hypothetical protein
MHLSVAHLRAAVVQAAVLVVVTTQHILVPLVSNVATRPQVTIHVRHLALVHSVNALTPMALAIVHQAIA